MNDSKLVPFEYQKDVVRDIEDFDGRSLCSLDMGLGKTACSLWVLKREKIQSWPAVVVCPASVKFAWESEAIRMGIRPTILEGTKPPESTRKSTPPRLTILNYDILKHWLPYLLKQGVSTVIFDESQMLQNRRAGRTKAALKLGRSAKHVIALSGTPLVNRPAELWPTLHMIRPDLYPSFWQFAQRFCKPRRTPWGWDFSGASNLDILHSTLSRTCFPYGIMIDTDRGLLPIGEIVENELPVRVRSCDSKGFISWKSVVAYSKRTTPSRVVRISFGGTELVCTPDHLIWTEEAGWNRAEKITPGMHLFVVWENLHRQLTLSYRSLEKGGRFNVLQPLMQCSTQSFYEDRRKENGRDSMGSPAGTSGNESLQALWKDYRKGWQTIFYMGQDEILFDELRQEIERKREKMENKINHQAMRMLQENYIQGNNERLSLGKNNTLFDAMCSDRQVARHKNASQIHQNISTCTQAFGCFGMGGIESRSTYTNEASGWSIQKRGLVDCLGRYRLPFFENRHRSRWIWTCEQMAESERYLERKTTQVVRVDRVEVLERGDRRLVGRYGSLDYVYDIEVEENHNFFANRCLVHNCMVRRLKKDVLKDLPEKMRCVVPVEISDRKEYELARDDFIGWLKSRQGDRVQSAMRAQQMTQIGYLLRLCAKLKLRAVVDWCNNFLEQTDEKLVVFAVHRKMIEAMDRRLNGNHVVVDGQVTGRLRKAQVDRFQRDKDCRVLIGNIKAAGTGITLTASSTVAFAELPWTPGLVAQGEDRCHRIGTKSTVWVHFLVAHGTIEEKLCKIIQDKQATIRTVLDGGVEEDDLTIMDQLIQELAGPGLLR